MNITTIFFDNDWGLVLEYMLEFHIEIVFVRKKNNDFSFSVKLMYKLV